MNKSKRRKGQSSIIDAFLFIMICSSAAVLMIYTAGLYGLNNSKQVSMAYNFEFINNALISMHYMQDNQGDFFWSKLSEKLICDGNTPCDEKIDVQSYLNGDAKAIWGNLTTASPSSKISLEFKSEEDSRDFYCHPSSSATLTVACTDSDNYADYTTIFSSSSGLKDKNADSWKITLRIYY